MDVLKNDEDGQAGEMTRGRIMRGLREKLKESVLERVWHFVVGYRYYAVVSVRKGTFEVGLHSVILQSRKEAERLLMGVESFREVEVVAFWSRERYVVDRADGRTVNYMV